MWKPVNWKLAERKTQQNPTSALQSFSDFIDKAFREFFKSVLKDCCRAHTCYWRSKQAPPEVYQENPQHPGCSLPGQGSIRQDFHTSLSYKNNEVVPKEHVMGVEVMKGERNLLLESRVRLLPGGSAPRYVCAWKASHFLTVLTKTRNKPLAHNSEPICRKEGKCFRAHL